MGTSMGEKDKKLARNLIILVVALFIIPFFFRVHPQIGSPIKGQVKR